MSDLHQLTFKFPAGPSKVLVTGTFDNWSRSTPLTKTSNGFELTVGVPWNAKITYKYIVDGQWFASPTEPQEKDGMGNINNTYTSPSNPNQPAAEPAPPGEQPKTTFQEIKDSVIAATGAPTLTSYVASGLGAAVAAVAGYDPINPQHIPIEEAQKAPASGQSNSATCSFGVSTDPHNSAQDTTGTQPAPTVETVSEPVHVNGDATIPKPVIEEEVASPAIIPPAVSATVAEVAEKVEYTASNEPEPIPVPNAPEPYPAVDGKTTTTHPEELPTVVVSTEDEKIAATKSEAPAKEETPPAPKSETKEITPRNSTASPPRASNVTPPTTPKKKGFPSETASSITDSPSKRKKRLSFFGKIKEVLTPEKKHKRKDSTSS
ncbi:hypothetical protein FS842_010745 [Serendipita sp. 407]|nr:hypothetical protein FS842_010745 [Serendipita sp. 407]